MTEQEKAALDEAIKAGEHAVFEGHAWPILRQGHLEDLILAAKAHRDGMDRVVNVNEPKASAFMGAMEWGFISCADTIESTIDHIAAHYEIRRKPDATPGS